MSIFSFMTGLWYEITGRGVLSGREKRPEWVSCRITGAPSERRWASSAIRLNASRFSSWIQSCPVLVRPSSTTEVASTQSSPAPPDAIRRIRRIVSSPGAPSGVESKPSIGWIVRRFFSVTRVSPTVSGSARTERSCEAGRETPSLSCAARKSSSVRQVKRAPLMPWSPAS